jgi:RHS repeat-associated protein
VLRSPNLTGLAVEQRGLSQILVTFSEDRQHGRPRTDVGSFVYGDERIAGFSSRTPRGERYYGYDALGSNRTVTNENGRVDGVQSFDPWGVPDPGNHAGNGQGIALLTGLFGYTGERQDAWTGQSEQAGQTGQAGAVYLRARWLHPHYGRFLSPDPYAGAIGRPSSQNDHAYAEGTRTSRVDPSIMAGIQ